MPSHRTVYGWLARGDTGQEPYAGFLKRYVRARELQQDALLDEILVIADDGRNDWMQHRTADGETVTVFNKEAVQRSRIRIEARFRLAEKLAPRKYGPRAEVNHITQPVDVLREIVRRASAQPDIPPGAYLDG